MDGGQFTPVSGQRFPDLGQTVAISIEDDDRGPLLPGRMTLSEDRSDYFPVIGDIRIDKDYLGGLAASLVGLVGRVKQEDWAVIIVFGSTLIGGRRDIDQAVAINHRRGLRIGEDIPRLVIEAEHGRIGGEQNPVFKGLEDQLLPGQLTRLFPTGGFPVARNSLSYPGEHGRISFFEGLALFTAAGECPLFIQRGSSITATSD
jgi:hypothetical protein